MVSFVSGDWLELLLWMKSYSIRLFPDIDLSKFVGVDRKWLLLDKTLVLVSERGFDTVIPFPTVTPHQLWVVQSRDTSIIVTGSNPVLHTNAA